MRIICRYPIYHIPMGRTIKDLSTCFLTYHTLSSSFQGKKFHPSTQLVHLILFHFLLIIFTGKLIPFWLADTDLEDDMVSFVKKRKEGEGIPLPPFGLSTYKMQGSLWVSDRSEIYTFSRFFFKKYCLLLPGWYNSCRNIPCQVTRCPIFFFVNILSN